MCNFKYYRINVQDNMNIFSLTCFLIAGAMFSLRSRSTTHSPCDHISQKRSNCEKKTSIRIRFLYNLKLNQKTQQLFFNNQPNQNTQQENNSNALFKEQTRTQLPGASYKKNINIYRALRSRTRKF